MKRELHFTEDQLTELVMFNVPHVAYVLEDGLAISDVTFQSRVGMWKLRWVGTKGSQAQRTIIVTPGTPEAKSIARNTRIRYYMSYGFSEREAHMLAGIVITGYYIPENINFLYALHTSKDMEFIIHRALTKKEQSPIHEIIPMAKNFNAGSLRNLVHTYCRFTSMLEEH